MKKFHTRSFVSFILLFTVIWLLISGTVLYIAPPGRVAHWQHWELFGFNKDQWQAQHTLFSYLFVIVAAFHIFSINWRNLWSYVKLKTTSGFRKQKEFVVASLVILIVFVGTGFNLPPFSTFFDLGETIGFSWEEKQLRAPVPHTENLTLVEISDNQLHVPVDELIDKLKNKGITVRSESQTLNEIAVANGKTPAEIYLILVPEKQQKSMGGSSGMGYGRMTIREIALDQNVDVNEIISLLKSNNIGADPDQTVKDVASEYDLHPSEVVRLIRGESH